MKPFSFARSPELLVGPGTFGTFLDRCAARNIDDVILITGAGWFPGSRFDRYVDTCFPGRVRKYTVTGEPSPETIDSIVSDIGDEKPGLVVGIGGGSVLDTAKAVSAMACEARPVEEFLEGVGDRVPSGRRLPLAAIPTTAGTGSEATKNAVISRIGEAGFKKSLRHDGYIPDYAILDPELAAGCPPGVTSASGLDAITQLIEAHVSNKASTLSLAISGDGLSRCRAFEKVMENPDDLDARSEMAYAAYASGIALANAGLGVVHGLASPLGAIRPAAHGAICAALLYDATQYVTGKLAELGPAGREGLAAYARVGRLLDPSRADDVGDARAVDLLLERILVWIRRYDIPNLEELGFTLEDLDAASKSASPKNTPCDLSKDEIHTICTEAYSR